ncbi:MAG: type I restriction-modification enzyme R subunit C-terminal domain-containing protein, partial [Devosiaceae bacterium]
VDSDLFDVLSYILFTHEPKTRHERAEHVRSDGLADAEGDMKALLLAILNAYEERGEAELATKKLGTFLTARYGSVSEGKVRLGGLNGVKNAFFSLQRELYSTSLSKS